MSNKKASTSTRAASRLSRQAGSAAAFPICPGPVPLEKALTGAEENLLAAARNALRLFLAGNK